MNINKNLIEEAIRRTQSMLAGAADAGWQDAPAIEVTWRYHGRGMRDGDTCPAIITTAAGITALAVVAEDVLVDAACQYWNEPPEGTITSWWDLMPLMWQQELDERTVFYFPGLTVDE